VLHIIPTVSENCRHTHPTTASLLLQRGVDLQCTSQASHLNALLSALRPAYSPGGFCVANSMKCGCGRTTSWSSGTNNSRLSSSSLQEGMQGKG
jgi:hypothetical protein